MQVSYKLVSKGVQGVVLVVQPRSALGWCEHSSATEGTERRKGQLGKTRTRKVEKLSRGMKEVAFAPLPLAMG